jgi:hypothetical protein
VVVAAKAPAEAGGCVALMEATREVGLSVTRGMWRMCALEIGPVLGADVGTAPVLVERPLLPGAGARPPAVDWGTLYDIAEDATSGSLAGSVPRESDLFSRVFVDARVWSGTPQQNKRN